MTDFAGGAQKASLHRMAKKSASVQISVRGFLEWARANGESEDYWDNVFRWAGIAGVARRSFWQKHLTELRDGNPKAWNIFWREERKLFKPANDVFDSQISTAQRGHLWVIEPACGPGLFTGQWMPQVLSRGGEYLAFDRSSWAVSQTKNLISERQLRHETGRIVQASASEVGRIFATYGAQGAYKIAILVRFVHHIVQNLVCQRFLGEIGKNVDRVLFAETVLDRLPPDRPQNPGTKFRTIEQISGMLGMNARRTLWCKVHNDNIAVVDFAK